MSQQGALRSNNANTSNILSVTHPQQSASIKRVSFHDTNANPESTQRNFTSGNLNTTASVTMDIIAEDPNVRSPIYFSSFVNSPTCAYTYNRCNLSQINLLTEITTHQQATQVETPLLTVYLHTIYTLFVEIICCLFVEFHQRCRKFIGIPENTRRIWNSNYW